MARDIVYVDSKQVIYDDDTSSPILAPDSDDNPYSYQPWKWDDRIWTSPDYENLDVYLPALHDAGVWGIPENYWQCGVADTQLDLEVIGATLQRQESVDKWTFKVRHGNYYRFHDKRYLFADRSIIQHVDNAENEDSRNILQLSRVPRAGSPVRAVIWQRNAYTHLVTPFRVINKKTNFSGLYSASGELQPTRTGNLDEIAWSNVDTSKKEFVVDYAPEWLKYAQLGDTPVGAKMSVDFSQEVGSTIDSTEGDYTAVEILTLRVISRL
jgi:hypothetical protein